ncbi:hypothetical protein LTS18_014958, partial [Coniosporium uncinatum]
RSTLSAGQEPDLHMPADVFKAFLISFPPFVLTGAAAQEKLSKPTPPTMPRRRLGHYHRTYSWPPCTQLLPNDNMSKREPLPDIDDEPFAHFITPITEADDPFDASLFNAGIEPAEPAASRISRFRARLEQRWSQYVARHHVLLHAVSHEDFTAGDFFATRPRQRRNANTFCDLDSPRPPSLTPTIKIITPEDVERELAAEREAHYELTRGRASDLLADTARQRRRGCRPSRTLSGRRHSWREPSTDIFTVIEEPETAAIEKGDGGYQEESEDLGHKRPDSGVWLGFDS